MELLESIDAGGNVLLLTDGLKRDVYLSTRNLQGVLVRPWGEASAYDLLWSDVLIIEDSALEAVAADAGNEEDQ